MVHCTQDSCRSKRHVAQQWNKHISTKMHDLTEGDKKEDCKGEHCRYCKGKSVGIFHHGNFSPWEFFANGNFSPWEFFAKVFIKSLEFRCTSLVEWKEDMR